MSHRQRVLALYHRILLTGARWSGPADERKYIIEEAQRLFRKNKNIEDPEAIERKLFEAEARLELGVHYRNPYPRRYHAPPNTSGRAVSEGRIARSAYQDSLYDA